MPSKRIVSPHLGLLTVFVVFAQLASAQAPIGSRIVRPVDETQWTVLKGNVHPLARPEFDQGPAPASLAMDHMLMVLKRSPEQEGALESLLAQQQDRNSPNYHQWLPPESFGHQFGSSDADVQTIVAWLASHGFQNIQVSRDRKSTRLNSSHVIE
jgi:trimeric autotransporter adhesin